MNLFFLSIWGHKNKPKTLTYYHLIKMLWRMCLQTLDYLHIQQIERPISIWCSYVSAPPPAGLKGQAIQKYVLCSHQTTEQLLSQAVRILSSSSALQHNYLFFIFFVYVTWRHYSYNILLYNPVLYNDKWNLEPLNLMNLMWSDLFKCSCSDKCSSSFFAWNKFEILS